MLDEEVIIKLINRWMRLCYLQTIVAEIWYVTSWVFKLNTFSSNLFCLLVFRYLYLFARFQFHDLRVNTLFIFYINERLHMMALYCITR